MIEIIQMETYPTCDSTDLVMPGNLASRARVHCASREIQAEHTDTVKNEFLRIKERNCT